MKVNGQVNKEMDLAFKFGLMEQNTKDNGKKIGQMEKANFVMPAEIYMMEIGKRIELVAKENTFMQTALDMMEAG